VSWQSRVVAYDWVNGDKEGFYWWIIANSDEEYLSKNLRPILVKSVKPSSNLNPNPRPKTVKSKPVNSNSKNPNFSSI